MRDPIDAVEDVIDPVRQFKEILAINGSIQELRNLWLSRWTSLSPCSSWATMCVEASKGEMRFFHKAVQARSC